jgi:hypothetical protein
MAKPGFLGPQDFNFSEQTSLIMPPSLVTYQKSKALSTDPQNCAPIQIHGINPPSVKPENMGINEEYERLQREGEAMAEEEAVVMPNLNDLPKVPTMLDAMQMPPNGFEGFGRMDQGPPMDHFMNPIDFKAGPTMEQQQQPGFRGNLLPRGMLGMDQGPPQGFMPEMFPPIMPPGMSGPPGMMMGLPNLPPMGSMMNLPQMPMNMGMMPPPGMMPSPGMIPPANMMPNQQYPNK